MPPHSEQEEHTPEEDIKHAQHVQKLVRDVIDGYQELRQDKAKAAWALRVAVSLAKQVKASPLASKGQLQTVVRFEKALAKIYPEWLQEES